MVEVRLVIGSKVKEILIRNKEIVPTPVQALAMIDTGATGTVVRQDLVESLKLNPIGVTLINTPSSINVKCYEYLMRILFPVHHGKVWIGLNDPRIFRKKYSKSRKPYPILFTTLTLL